MKTYKNIVNIILLFTITLLSVGCKDSCEDRLYSYLTKEEMKFIPYESNDSIEFESNVMNNFYLTTKERKWCDPCSRFYEDEYCKDGGYFEIAYEIDIVLNSNIPFFNDILCINLSMYEEFDLGYVNFSYYFNVPDINKKPGKENIIHRNYRYISRNELEFVENDSDTNNIPQTIYFDKYTIDEIEFIEAHLFIDPTAYFDTIIYSPNYGFLKFANDSVSYHFVKKHK